MSEENLRLVREVQDEWNRGEPTIDLRCTTDTYEVFDKFELDYEFEDLGTAVLAWGMIHIRAKGSGVETDIESGGLYLFRDGKIVRWQDFGSKEKALQAMA